MRGARAAGDMSIDVLLSKLEGVKQITRGRWLAKCPAHADRRPSLSVRALDEGRVLVHDFGGCSVGDVLAAVGLTFGVLDPEKLDEHHVRSERRPFPASDVLRAVAHEALIVGRRRVAHRQWRRPHRGGSRAPDTRVIPPDGSGRGVGPCVRTRW